MQLKKCIDKLGGCKFNDDGLILKGTIVRNLILPNHTKNTIDILKWLKDNLPNDILISIMAQYIPMGEAKDYQSLNRKINKIEYNKVQKFIYDNNIENGYIQDLSSAITKYIPKFEGDD